jgi:radical SAM protein (TIGR01212 family)
MTHGLDNATADTAAPVTTLTRSEAPARLPTWQERGLRYYRYSHFLRERFGAAVHRVSIDGGFTCPNVDGTVARGGCVYCDNRSFSPARRIAKKSIEDQVADQIARLDRRYAASVYLAYFQAATNTYAPVARLKDLYERALALPRIAGLIVSTRPDCLDDEALDLLQSYAERMYVGLEIGLQTVHDRSLVWMNRGHDAASFFAAMERAKGRGLDLATHVILGLPGESVDDMLATADAVAASGVDGVKIHNLHVVRHTPLNLAYRKGQVSLLERDAYLDVLVPFLERLPERTVIHRVMGDAPPKDLVAPAWTHEKQAFLTALENEMARRGTRQGRATRQNATLGD